MRPPSPALLALPCPGALNLLSLSTRLTSHLPQGICPDEFCSKSCLMLKYRLRRGFLAPTSRRALASPSPAGATAAAASPSPFSSPAASPGASPANASTSFASAPVAPMDPGHAGGGHDVLEARRQGEMRVARALGWKTQPAKGGSPSSPKVLPGISAQKRDAQERAAQKRAAQEAARKAASVPTPVTNGSLMDRYLSEEGLLRSNDAP